MRGINRHYVLTMWRVADWNLTFRVCPCLNMRHGFTSESEVVVTRMWPIFASTLSGWKGVDELGLLSLIIHPHRAASSSSTLKQLTAFY